MSNNDRQLRIFDMPSMRPVEAICCPAPINYAALSPEGDLLACVGDSGETHLFRAAPSGAFEPPLRPTQPVQVLHLPDT